MFPHHLLKRLAPPLELLFSFVWNWAHWYGSTSEFSTLFHWSSFYPSSVPQCLDYCSYTVGLNFRKISPILFFFFKAVLAIWWPLPLHMKFRISLSLSAKKKIAEILIKITLNLRSIWRITDIFIMVNLPIHGHGTSF